MKNYISPPQAFSHSRGRSPIYLSSPPSHQKPIISPLIQRKSPAIIRAVSVSPFKRVNISGLSSQRNNIINNSNEASLFWKNKYESLQTIYQLEIDELRRFYSLQTTQNSEEVEINLLKKDNRILSEFIKSNQEEIEQLVNKNKELSEKYNENLVHVEKINDLLTKNSELNILMDRKTEEIAEIMLENCHHQELLSSKNDEIDHLKGLVTQLIQDNDSLSELLETLKANNTEISKEFDRLKRQLQENNDEKEYFQKELQNLKIVNGDLNDEIEKISLNIGNREEGDMKNRESVVFAKNFQKLKEENYKMKKEIQGYYGDILLMKEKEKILRFELEKRKNGKNSVHSKEANSILIK